MTETTFTIAYADFSRLVGIVGPCASRDPLLPIFTCLHFSEHEGRIEVAATDRFTFAVARGETKMPDGMDFVLPLKSVKHILATFKPGRRETLATFKPGRRETLDLAFTVGDEAVSVTTTQPALNQPTVTASYNLTTMGAFPKTRHFDIAPSDDMSPLNPAYMRRLPTLNRNEPVWFRGGGSGKVCAFYGPDWVIYIMAMRAAEGQSDWAAQWTAKDASTDPEPVSA